MAQKHKSKYKAPKDLEKSQKPKTRKDLKDYTHDDKKGALNPKSTGDAQLNVLRKRDKEMVDTGDMYVKYNADDRLYKDLEDGEWEPKHAAKILKKRQETEKKEVTDVLQDKIENLTLEQKERLVREYVRRKIYKLLREAEETPTEETPTEEVPTEEVPTADTSTTPTPSAPVAPSPEMPSAAPTETPMPTDAPVPTETPAPEETSTDTSADVAADTAEKQTPIDSFILDLQGKNNRKKLQTIGRALNKLFPPDSDARIRNQFYLMLQQYSKRMLQSQPETSES